MPYRHREDVIKEIECITYKLCSACNEWLPIDMAFAPMSSGLGGVRGQCRKCAAIIKRIKHPPKPKPAPLTDEQKKQRSRGYYEKHKDKRLAACRQYYLANKDHIRARNDAYEERNKEKLAAAKIRYRDTHRKESNAYFTERYQNDHEYRTLQGLRQRLNRAVKLMGGEKAGRTVDLLGCSVTDLMKHLEAAFQPGMTWENRGVYKAGGLRTWHIDHIRPCASFDLTDPEQQRICFHWTNLQPLWADENISKNDRYDGPT